MKRRRKRNDRSELASRKNAADDAVCSPEMKNFLNLVHWNESSVY